LCILRVISCFRTIMRTWTLHGVKIGTYCDASVLNDLSNLEDMHTFADETVRRFDDNMEMDGADVSGFYSVYCAIKATKRMTAVEIRQLLDDTALFNTTKTPSLIYVDIGTKVCICHVESIRLAVFVLQISSSKNISRVVCHVLNSHKLLFSRGKKFP